MTEADRFPMQVFFSAADEGYIAIAPDFPGSSAFGETQEVAIKELKIVIDLAIEALSAVGNPIPVPSEPPESVFSGKVLLRMPKSMHAKLVQRAKQEGSSLNQYINLLLIEENSRRSLEESRNELKTLLAALDAQKLVANRCFFSAFDELQRVQIVEATTTTPSFSTKRWLFSGGDSTIQQWSDDDGDTFNLAKALPHVPVLRK